MIENLSKDHIDLFKIKAKGDKFILPLLSHQEAQTGTLTILPDKTISIEGEGGINIKALNAYDEVLITDNIHQLLDLIESGTLNVIYAHDGILDTAYYKAQRRAKELIFLFTPLNIDELKSFNLTISKIDKPDYKNLEDSLLTREVIFQPKNTGFKIDDTIDDELTFAFKDITYHLIGTNRIKKTRIQLILTAFHKGNSFTDSVSLYSFKSRKSISRHIADELNLQSRKIENQLLTILNHLQEVIKERSKATEEEPITLTDEERNQAIQFLSQKNLLDNICFHIQQINNLAGEEINIKLAYLVAISRLTNACLSGMIRSSSGSGKSFLLNAIANVTPQESVLFLSRMSKNALFYHENLDRKMIIIDEAESNDAVVALRTLLTSKKLSVSFVDRDPYTGKQKTVTNEIHANVSYLDSSTKNTEPELESRAFILKVAETTVQTEAIFKAQREKKTLIGLDSSRTNIHLIKLLQNAQRVLRPLPVVIDFADKITFYNKHLKARRWHEKFLNLIEVSAYLNQYQRKIKQSKHGEYILANKEDYTLAYDLIKHTMTDSFSELDSVAMEIWKAIYTHVEQIALENNLDQYLIEFSRKDISEWTKKPIYILKRQVPSLISSGYLEKVSASGQGGRHKYTISHKYEAIDPFSNIKAPLVLFSSSKDLASKQLETIDL